MKVACDRCLKIEDADGYEVKHDWLVLTTNYGTRSLFCKKCSDVYWDTMFKGEKDGEENESISQQD